MPDERLRASKALLKWLDHGGPSPSSYRTGKGAPPLTHWSGKVEIVGDEDNILLRATSTLEQGHFVLAVAMTSVMHPRSEAIAPARRHQVEVAAAALRRSASWATPLVDGSDEGRLELIVLLAIELLELESSVWKPYLQSLPTAESCAPPSLWRWACGDTGAAELLRDTSIGATLAQDDADLEAILGSSASLSIAAMLGVEAADEDKARGALLRALALVSTRLVSGAGMVPLLDLVNGASAGEHNATIERTNLAASQTAPEQAPCVAVITSRRVEKGEELLLNYGQLSAAKFLYKYGWLVGGPDSASASTSSHDVAAVVPRGLLPSLRPSQRAVFERYKLSAAKLGLDAAQPSECPFSVPVPQAAEGKTTPLMRQVALLASCADDAALKEIAATGKMGDKHGVSPADIGACVLGWCTAHATQLASNADAAATHRARLAIRVRRGEREGLLRWAGALQAKHSLDASLVAPATEAHKAANKATKQAFKKAAGRTATTQSPSTQQQQAAARTAAAPTASTAASAAANGGGGGKVCASCGAEVRKKFCESCGAKWVAPDGSAPSQQMAALSVGPPAPELEPELELD